MNDPVVGTFSPRPGSAPFPRQVLAQARMESRLMMRNGEQVLLAVVIPVVVLIGSVAGIERVGLQLDHRPIDVLAPGVLALAVMSTAFTSLAIATGFERRYGVLKRLGSSPLPRHGLLLGKIGALLLVQLVQLVAIGLVAFALGWHPHTNVVGLVLALVLGTAAFAALGLLVAGTLRAEATLAVANLIYLLLLAGGAVVIPASAYGAASGFVTWLPSGALGEAMRAALIDATVDGRSLIVLAAWAAVGSLLAGRSFSWE